MYIYNIYKIILYIYIKLFSPSCSLGTVQLFRPLTVTLLSVLHDPVLGLGLRDDERIRKSFKSIFHKSQKSYLSIMLSLEDCEFSN